MKSLFMCEFGEPSHESYSNSKYKPIFVAADSYGQAVKIGETYLAEQLSNSKDKILNEAGDLVYTPDKKDTVKTVKLVSERIYGL